jgi:hypothetical protein
MPLRKPFVKVDAAPHSDRVARIVRAFEHDPAPGGLGGRDIVHERNGILQGQKRWSAIMRTRGCCAHCRWHSSAEALHLRFANGELAYAQCAERGGKRCADRSVRSAGKTLTQRRAAPGWHCAAFTETR